PLMSPLASSERALEEMDNRELRAEIGRLKIKHLPYPFLACEMHLRWAIAFAAFLFCLMGIPLAIQLHRGGRSIGFGLSLVIMVAYYVLGMGGTAAGQRSLLPPWLAEWLGNIALLGCASFLYWRFSRR